MSEESGNKPKANENFLKSTRALKHGAYIVKSVDDDPHPEIRAWLDNDYQEMAEDFGGVEKMSGKQVMQARNALRCLNVLYHFEAYMSENGIFRKPGEPHPLIERYLAHINALSRVLQSLGLEKAIDKNMPDSLRDVIDAVKNKKKQAPVNDDQK